MLKQFSLSKTIVGSKWLAPSVIANADGSLARAFQLSPLECGRLEEDFEGPVSDLFFTKLGDLLTRIPNGFEGQVVFRRQSDDSGFYTEIFIFERAAKPESYSHLKALLEELGLAAADLSEDGWFSLLAAFLGNGARAGVIPDLIWEKDCLKSGESISRVLSLTELPQVSWKGCFQTIFEYPGDFALSIKFAVPNREKVRRSLETKRRVSHAMAIASSLEVRNIESNSVLSSSEETLERILVGKETLFEMSLGVVLHGQGNATLDSARELERIVSGVGNAGLFMEGVGCLPVLRSHIPGNKTLGIRKLAILSGNLGHLLPLVLDYSRLSDPSQISLQSRNGEVCTLNLFSKENLNFNSFLCGASGSGKSFLMNAILSGALKDEKNLKLCIFDIGGSYKKIVSANGGTCRSLSTQEASSLLGSFLKTVPVKPEGFFKAFLETLCGSGTHITHSHRVAFDELLREVSGEFLSMRKLISLSLAKPERFSQEIAHWLKPHAAIDDLSIREDLISLIKAPVAAFDFKELEGDPILQKATILLLSELLWRDLVVGKYPRTLIVFDEVWRFFAESKEFLEEMYRTLRKYRAGIVSITQNLSDYGDEAFAKMLFTNSFTKIFLQSGAGAEFLRNTFDLSESDVQRAISVASKKPIYSEFFALTPRISQIYRLYPTAEFYELANTENVSQN